MSVKTLDMISKYKKIILVFLTSDLAINILEMNALIIKQDSMNVSLNAFLVARFSSRTIAVYKKCFLSVLSLTRLWVCFVLF